MLSRVTDTFEELAAILLNSIVVSVMPIATPSPKLPLLFTESTTSKNAAI